MEITAREAQPADLDDLVRMYRLLETEMTALKAMWPLADGLPEPVETALKQVLDDPDSAVIVGRLDGAAVGFLTAGSAPLLPQAGGERIGEIRLIFTEEPARAVGVAAAMMNQALTGLRARGLRRFDVRVLPGHRNAKNFFEANGFAARSITMYHHDEA